MLLQDFVSTPAPKKLVLDTPEIVAQYGEPIEFFILSPMPLDQYLKLSSLNTVDFLKEVLIREDGSKVLTEGVSLSMPFMTQVSAVIWADLGKLPGKN